MKKKGIKKEGKEERRTSSSSSFSSTSSSNVVSSAEEQRKAEDNEDNAMIQKLKLENRSSSGSLSNTETEQSFADKIKIYNIHDLISKEDPDNLFSNPRKIGEGAAGEIYLANYNKTGQPIALKKMVLSPETEKTISTEVSIMKSCNHPNIINFVDCFLVFDKLWVAMEYMDAGSLADLLECFEFVQLPERQVDHSLPFLSLSLSLSLSLIHSSLSWIFFSFPSFILLKLLYFSNIHLFLFFVIVVVVTHFIINF